MPKAFPTGIFVQGADTFQWTEHFRIFLLLPPLLLYEVSPASRSTCIELQRGGGVSNPQSKQPKGPHPETRNIPERQKLLTLAHDVNMRLLPIILSTELLMETDGLSLEQEKYVKLIRSRAIDMRTLVASILHGNAPIP